MKDIFAFTEACKYATENPNSRIMYLFPTGKQGKMALLDGVTFQNEPIISSVVNPKLLKRPRSGALYHFDGSIKWKNGSTITVVGDDSDTLVGNNQNLLVVSEAAMVRKKTIDVLVPSILKIGGRIICVSSPRYGSHFNKSILENAGELLTSVFRADQIYDNEGNRIYTDEDLRKAKSMMSIEAYRSEYMVDLSSHNETSIYGLSLEAATYVDYPSWIKQTRVFISCDLGIADNSAFTFGVQDLEGNIIIIDQYRNRGQATQHYIDYIKNWAKEREIPMSNITIILPHDSNNTMDAGVFLTSRTAHYQNAGFRVAVLRPMSVIRTIEMTRTMMINGRLRFAKVSNVERMIQIIKAYQWKTTASGDMLGVPEHGTAYASSNDADSLEYMVVAMFLDEFERTHKTESGVIFKNDRY